MNNRIEIGKSLQNMRESEALTIRDVSFASGYTPQHLYAMEKGNKLSVTSLIDILNCFGYEIEFVKKNA